MGYRIAVSGSYGGMNLGDEAILEVILGELRACPLDVDVVVFSKNPADTEARHKVRALAIREIHKDELLRELRRLDLLVLGGGGILFEGLAEECLRDVNWTKELGIPVMVYAVSVGPLQSAESKRLVVDSLNRVDRVTVREAEAKRILHDLGVEHDIEVTADPALLLEARPFTEEMLAGEGIRPGVPLVGFSIREPGPAAPKLDEHHAVLANAADYMVERFDAQILFVPMERGGDPQHSHAVIARMANAQRASVLKGDYTSGQTLGLMRHMSFAVGMRLHFLIFAGIQRVPFVPLPYASKVSGFLADLDLPMPSIAELNPGKLCAYLDRSWDHREALRAKLDARIPPLQERAKRTNAVLCELLRARPPREAGG